MFFVLQRAWTYLPAFTVVVKRRSPPASERRDRRRSSWLAVALRALLELADENRRVVDRGSRRANAGTACSSLAVERGHDRPGRCSVVPAPGRSTVTQADVPVCVLGTGRGRRALADDRLVAADLLGLVGRRVLQLRLGALALRDLLRVELHVLREVDLRAVGARRLLRVRSDRCCSYRSGSRRRSSPACTSSSRASSGVSFAVTDWISSAWATLRQRQRRDDRHDGGYQVLAHGGLPPEVVGIEVGEWRDPLRRPASRVWVAGLTPAEPEPVARTVTKNTLRRRKFRRSAGEP